MNIKRMLRKTERDILKAEGLDYGRSFWRPILSRWLIWAGAAWSIGSVLIIAPLIARMIKAVL